MLTAADIRNALFVKIMGGYKMADVDIFLDQCADTVEALNKSIDALNAEKKDMEEKMEALADKLVEYRNDEDSIRSALLSAQRLGDTVVREANHKATLILEDATIKGDKIVQTAENNIVDATKEFKRIRDEVTRFKADLLSVYHEHLRMVGLLPEEETVEDAGTEPAEAEDLASRMEDVAAAEADEEAAEETADEPLFEVVDESVFAGGGDEAGEPAHASRFGNLKFGEDYDISADNDDSEDAYKK